MAFLIITVILIVSFIQPTIPTCYREDYNELICRSEWDSLYGRQKICDKYYILDCYMISSNLDSIHKSDIRKIEIFASNIGPLNSKLFAGFDNVKIISMIGVNVTGVESYSFQDLKELTDLNLSNNSIHVLSSNSFRSFSLNTVNLSNNNITSIEHNLFINLNTLLLNRNKIVDASNLMTDCYELTQLDLSYNFIRELNLGEGCLSLLYLDISYNEITTFSVNSNTPFNLNSLYLSSNKLYDISSSDLQHLNNLSILDLSRNPLFQKSNPATDLFHHTKHLTYLNLSSTGIEKITVGTFTKLFKLQELDLSHNNLSFISQGIFHDMGSLKKLYINNNRLIRFRYEGLTNLQEIDLNGNMWPCDTLADLTSKLRNSTVHIQVGDTHNIENILGIRCSDLTTDTIPTNNLSSEIITKQEEEYYALLNNLNLNIQQLILQENQSNAYWSKINQDYKDMFQIVEANVKAITHQIMNALNLTQNANKSQFSDDNFQTFASKQWKTIATNFTELLGDSKTFLEKIENIFNTTLSKIQINFEKTLKTDRENITEELRNIFDSSLTKIQVNFQQIVRSDRKSFVEEIRNIFSSILSTIQESNKTSVLLTQIFNKSDAAHPKTLSLKSANEKLNTQNCQPLVIGVYGILTVLVLGLIFYVVIITKTRKMVKSEPREFNIFSNMPI